MFSFQKLFKARNEELGKKALDELTSSGLTRIRFHQLDIDNAESIERFKNYLTNEHGGLDVLVNNAAIIVKPEDALAYQIPQIKIAQDTVRVNFTATLNVCNALFPLLRENARVVNVASRAGMLSVIKNDSLKEKLTRESATVEDIVEVMDLFVE